MAKNDVVVRTPQDLERKYNLASLLGLSKNVEINKQGMQKIENELNNFINTTVGDIEDLQEQIDGKVTTWYYIGEPTLNNEPAISWETDDIKSEHIGDLYYDKSTGYSYIFQFNSTYYWEKISDQDVTESLAIANAAKDTADSKRQVFITQPTIPYDTGDLWISDNEIFICQVSRHTGAFNSDDWINNLKYTDDTVANAVGEELTVLEGTVQTITKNYVKYTDLSTGGSTTIAGDNVNTGVIKSNGYISDVKGMAIDLDNGTIDSTNFKLDDEGNVDIRGLLNTAKGLLSNLQYEDTNIVGQVQESYGGLYIRKGTLKFDVYIPENFEIESATVNIIAYKTKNAYLSYSTGDISWIESYGKLQNIRLYKDPTIEEYTYSSELGVYNSSKTPTEITGAFGSGGYTNPSTEQATFSSINIKDSLNKGQNILTVQTADNVLDQETVGDAEKAAQQTQVCFGTVDIVGYISKGGNG